MDGMAQTPSLRPRQPFAACVGMAVALAFVFATLGNLVPILRVAREYQPAYTITAQTQQALNASPFAQIMGEIRTSAADLMWVKTDRYLHRGVAYEAHIIKPLEYDHEDGEAEHPAEGSVDAHEDDHDGHDHEKPLATLIPVAQGDYRGFIGTLQRNIQPWNQPGAPDEHSSENELLPWYRLLTLSNPHHWRGYTIGTWWLSKQKNESEAACDEAEKFIAEGIRNNPEVFQLRLMQGRVFMRRGKWSEAITSFEQAAQLALKTRPAGGGAQPSLWSLDDEEDFGMAVRYVPILQWRKLNDISAARQSVARGLQWLPADGPLHGMKAELDAATAARP